LDGAPTGGEAEVGPKGTHSPKCAHAAGRAIMKIKQLRRNPIRIFSFSRLIYRDYPAFAFIDQPHCARCFP
jgi:hypothetical protein